VGSDPGPQRKLTWSDVEQVETTINQIVFEYFTEHAPNSWSADDLAKTIYYNQFRVRRIPSAGQGYSLIMIAQIKRLWPPGTEHDSSRPSSIVAKIQAVNPDLLTVNPFAPWDQVLLEGYESDTERAGATNYEVFFNLLDPINFGGSMHAAKMTFLFRSGQHGTIPSIPWQVSQAGTAQVEVNNFSSLQIIEIPYTTTNTVAVHDLPPMYPDVNFYPVRHRSDKIKILLNQNNFKYSALPTVIQTSDNQLFSAMRETQGRPPGTPILFGADDTEVKFQIFRLEGVPPQTYLDFANKLIRTMNTTTSTNQSVTSAALIDNIKPNINYYYCFRTIDKGGWISNPTPIVRVQVVDDNGRMYPIIEPYNLELSNPLKTEKSFKKYLEIGASVAEQVVAPVDASAESAGSPYNIASALVGPEGGVLRDPVNKGFKIRITSKDTGKKIDLNVDFDVNQIANPNLVEEN